MPALVLLLPLVPQTEVTGQNFRVVYHGRETANARRLVEALDAGYPRVTDLLGVSPREPAPYTVHVFENADDYRRHDQEMNQGRFANNGAFAHRANQTAYLQFQPRAGVGLFDRMEALVLHESFHLVTFRHAPWVSNGPAWLYEGLAERAAEVCMGRSEASSFKFADPPTSRRRSSTAAAGFLSTTCCRPTAAPMPTFSHGGPGTRRRGCWSNSSAKSCPRRGAGSAPPWPPRRRPARPAQERSFWNRPR